MTQQKQLLHLVMGGRVTNPQTLEFADLNAIDVVGVFPDFASAHAAWKGAAQRTVDSAQTRYFIAHLHRLMDEGRETSPTAELGI